MRGSHETLLTASSRVAKAVKTNEQDYFVIGLTPLRENQKRNNLCAVFLWPREDSQSLATLKRSVFWQSLFLAWRIVTRMGQNPSLNGVWWGWRLRDSCPSNA